MQLFLALSPLLTHLGGAPIPPNGRDHCNSQSSLPSTPIHLPASSTLTSFFFFFFLNN
jgi:hypothetical protein